MTDTNVMDPEEIGEPVISLVDEPEIPLTELDTNPFVYNEDDPNLVSAFDAHPKGKAALQEIASIVDTDFTQDWDGCSRHRQMIQEDMRIFTGDLPKKTWPYENCANAHVPIMLTNCNRLQSRIVSEVFGDWTDVAAVVPVGPEDEDEAEILTQHLTWQLREQIPDFERQCQRGVQMFLIMGDVCCESYWDAFRRQNVHQMLTPDEFVVPFAFVSTQPDYSDLPHYTRVLRYYRHQLQAQRDRWFGVDEVLSKSKADWGEEMPFRDMIADVQGEEVPTELSKKAPYVLLKYYGWLELPNQDLDRWCQVIMDKSTKRILSLSIHEETNWQDRLRFERQTAEMSMYRANMQAHQAIMDQAAQQAAVATAADQTIGLGDEQRAALHANIMSQVPAPPPPPDWLSDPENLDASPAPVRKDPIHLFAHAVCLEPLAGAYGLSYGRILADYNRAANVALSQFIDAASLGNANGYIVADTVDFDRPFSWAPGKINKAKGVSGAELKDAIMPMQLPPANAQLVQIVEMMSAFGSDAAQSPEVLSGNPGKSGETYRGIATRIDQAVKNLTVIGRSVASFIQTILKNNAKLNAVFLPDEEIFQVTQGTLKYMKPMRVTREMYQRDYRVRIVSDLQFQGDQERIGQADQILQMCTAFPPLGMNVAFFYEAVKRALEARRERQMIPLLGPPPPNPMTPFGMPPPQPQPPPGAPPPPGQGPPGGEPPQGGPPHPGVPPGNHPQGVGGSAPGAPPPPNPPQPQAA